MNQALRSDAEQIVRSAIASVLPDEAVRRALANVTFPGRIILVAVGKAAWQMAKAARDCLPGKIDRGIVLTKYGHVSHKLENVLCLEAGHPVPDENSFRGTEKILEITGGLKVSDTVLFLLSGGSALFEKPLIPSAELQDITGQLLACGADIREINTIRKRLSGVKGGRFAQWCAPARVEAVILSDVLGDPPDMIASGPAAPDPTSSRRALEIVAKYDLKLSREALTCLERETPKSLDNVHTQIIGSVRQLCSGAEAACREMGYETVFLTDQLSCEAREAGRFLGAVLRSYRGTGRKLAFLAGGETVVHLTGTGKGGRNQEVALGAVELLRGIDDACVISVGSDGTDGPTDAAGGYADGDTFDALLEKQIFPDAALANNDAYHALKAIDGLIFTGPTGTNVNDISVALLCP